MKKLNCLLVHNGLKKHSPPTKCRNISHTANYFSPNPQPFWLWLHPRACSWPSLPQCLILESFPVRDRRHSIYVSAGLQVHVRPQACAHIHTQVHTHARVHIYVPLVHFTRSSGKSGKLLPGFPKCIFCSQPLNRPAYAF